MKKWMLFLIGVVCMVGCSDKQAFEPVEINPEIDVCEICNMSIAHEQYATEVISQEGEIYKFDDLGCMMEFLQNEMESEVAKNYVRDVESGEWVELEEAYFSFNLDFWTPMANGVVSFKDKESAEEYEQGKGRVYDYNNLLQHQWGFEQ